MIHFISRALRSSYIRLDVTCLPGETSVEVNAEVFNRFDLRNVCLVDVQWGALTPA